MEDRLEQQLGFILEADRLKTVNRRNPLSDGSRPENTAEHSWHLALMALILAEHTEQRVDLGRVIAMLIVHDLVEIDAGDTFVYDEVARESKASAETAAADRIFALLPPDQGQALRTLWDEFETADTSEARFARAVDRFSPLMLNHASGPASAWLAHGVTADRVIARNAAIGDSSVALWGRALDRIREAVERGHLLPGADEG